MMLDSDNILQAVCGQDAIGVGRESMKNLCLAMMNKPYRVGVKLPGLPFSRTEPAAINAYKQQLKEVLGNG